MALFAWVLCFLVSSVLCHPPDPSPGVTRLELQVGAFRMLQSNIYRQYVNYTFNDVPYEWVDFYGSTVGLLDLWLTLQLDPECNTQLMTFYNTMVAQVNRPHDDSNWWRDVYFIQCLEAFSCGYDDDNPTDVPKHMLPSDIKDKFDTDIVLRKTFRLMEGYNNLGTTCGKFTENYERIEDTDLSFYAALLDQRVGTTYMVDGLMRAGAPWYVGTGMWLMFHAIANRISEFPASEHGYLAAKFRNYFDYFAWHHPCPDCRHHLLFKVFPNDMDNTPTGSESNLYPLEWLFIAGDDRPDDATQEAKLATIVDADSTNLFVFHLHNAIDSAIESKRTCRYQENYDRLVTGHQGYRCAIWPWAKRYERSIGTVGEWEYVRDIHQDDLNNLMAVDRPDMRGSYWVEGIVPPDWATHWPLVEGAIVNVSQAVLDSGLLEREYSTPASFVDIDMDLYHHHVQTLPLLAAPPKRSYALYKKNSNAISDAARTSKGHDCMN